MVGCKTGHWCTSHIDNYIGVIINVFLGYFSTVEIFATSSWGDNSCVASALSRAQLLPAVRVLPVLLLFWRYSDDFTEVSGVEFATLQRAHWFVLGVGLRRPLPAIGKMGDCEWLGSVAEACQQLDDVRLVERSAKLHAVLASVLREVFDVTDPCYDIANTA